MHLPKDLYPEWKESLPKRKGIINLFYKNTYLLFKDCLKDRQDKREKEERTKNELT